ncbi:hypothetical protein CSA_021115 [Cucumis sativus]|uniref:Uncharacterized protein n=1 Tax=Cucumis sativus TaxID=3659 RepID=A0ACB6HBE6_CUCSA|nr:hypothetical protein CSA_021115 [Cucumis sativus]
MKMVGKGNEEVWGKGRSEPVVGLLTPSKKKEYRVTNRLQEGKRPLYAVVFNFIDSRYFNVFATVGGNRYSRENSRVTHLFSLKFLLPFDYYFLLGVGLQFTNVLKGSFVGHGDSINEIRDSATEAITCDLCKYLHFGFAGAGGHRNEVLSVIFIALLAVEWTTLSKNLVNERVLDIRGKIFYLDRSSIKVSHQVFIASVHSNYVDCSRWLGDFILSKLLVDHESMMGMVLPWGTVDILQKYPVPECDIWFIKFSCDFHYNAAAIGNREGKIFVWELQSSPQFSSQGCLMPSRSLLDRQPCPLMEDGTIWRWDAMTTT